MYSTYGCRNAYNRESELTDLRDRLGVDQLGELGLGLGVLLGELVVTLPDAGSPVGGVGGCLF
jgi:hypothetical protein